MSDSLFLFEPHAPEYKGKLQRKLAELASEQLYLGANSWKYEGWLDQVYTPERYYWHGKFSRKKFEAECLAEYAETFPVVCGDFSFYQFPTDDFWRKLFTVDAPQSLRFAFKIPEEITLPAFPDHQRYGARAGQRNPNFLNDQLLSNCFLKPLEPYQERVAVLIFEFGAFRQADAQVFEEFLQQLDAMFLTLPLWFRYAVEIRTAEFLDSEYFQHLHNHSVAHVFNSWTRMPPLAEQMALANAFTADFSVSRAVLSPGQTYAEGNAFLPFKSIQVVKPDVRRALRDLLTRGRDRKEAVYVFVNNGLEGNAPGTIEAVVQTL